MDKRYFYFLCFFLMDYFDLNIILILLKYYYLFACLNAHSHIKTGPGTKKHKDAKKKKCLIVNEDWVIKICEGGEGGGDVESGMKGGGV